MDKKPDKVVFAKILAKTPAKPKSNGNVKHRSASSNSRRKNSEEARLLKKNLEEQKRLEELTSTRHHILMLTRKTHFSEDQVEGLLKIFRRLTSLGKMDRLRFRETLYSTFEITDDLILDRTFSAFDGDSQGSVNETEWVLGMSAFLRGSLDEQIAYAYDIYDINRDHGIGREEVYHFLQNCLTPSRGGGGILALEPDEVAEGCRDIAELAMKKLDLDHNGIITYSDFHEAVNRDPLMLEALGPCFPACPRMKIFLSIFSDDYWNYSTSFSHPKDPAWNREQNKFNRKKELTIKSRTHDSSTLLTHRERKKIGVQIGSTHDINKFHKGRRGTTSSNASMISTSIKTPGQSSKGSLFKF